MNIKDIKVAELELYKTITLEEQFAKLLEEVQEVAFYKTDANLIEEIFDVIQSAYGMLKVLEKNGIDIKVSNGLHIKKMENRYES